MRSVAPVRSGLECTAAGLLLVLGSVATADAGATGIELAVDAGPFDRRDTPVQIEIRNTEVPPEIFARLGELADPVGVLMLRDADAQDANVIAQVDHPEDDPNQIRLSWILPGDNASGTRRVYHLEFDARPAEPGPWTFVTTPEGHLELSNRVARVFRYNTKPVTHPDHQGPAQPRSAYIHPAFSPSGALISGDYSAESHPHHRGFFLAYTKTEVGDLHPDFWNIQGGSGKIHCEQLGEVKAGPVSAQFSTFHRWEATRPGADPLVVLRERWYVEAFDIPGSPYWLVDIVSTQQATGEPMVLPPYRYGGMAYRGPDSFLPEGVLDVLTSEGHDRVEGDQLPARWVDLTGPIADGSANYAGAAMFDHPLNANHPTPARIHPTRIPFFCFVPSHDTIVTIGSQTPTVFRYRILIHDGHPDASLNERVWRDFAEPPTVTIAPIVR